MLFQNRYEYNPRIDFLANDGQAKSYKAYDVQQNRDVVIKFYYAIPSGSDEFRTRMEQIKQLRHDNLIQLYQYSELDNINALGEPEHLRIGIWEYAPISTFLADNNDPVSTDQAVRGVLQGLQYLHANGLTHGQLSMQNSFIDQNGKVKLSNYALAPAYLDTDFRAAGKMLHELLSDSSPGINDAGETYLRLPSNVREAYSALITQCLDKNEQFPSGSAGELLYFLDHYDRNKLFEQVLPLSEEQFISRYRFDLDTDKIDQSNLSLTYKAHDNLLNTGVFLEIFNIDNNINAAMTDSLDKSQYANLFKVAMSDNEGLNQIALIGVLSANNNTLLIDPRAGKDTLTIETAASVALLPDTHLLISDHQDTIKADETSEVPDSGEVVMADIDLAKELAALDTPANPILEDVRIISDDADINDSPHDADSEAQLNMAADNDHVTQAELSEEPQQNADAEENRRQDSQELVSSDDNSTAAAVDDDDSDLVSLDTGKQEEEEPQNVNTEFIQHEAIAQVQRDLERWLLQKNNDD